MMLIFQFNCGSPNFLFFKLIWNFQCIHFTFLCWNILVFLHISAPIRPSFWINNLLSEDSKEAVTKTQSITDNQGLEQNNGSTSTMLNRHLSRPKTQTLLGKEAQKRLVLKWFVGSLAWLLYFCIKESKKSN